MTRTAPARTRHVTPPGKLTAIALLALGSSGAFAADACLLTPAELQAATGRVYGEGQPSKDALNSTPLCHYAERDQPQRKLTIGFVKASTASKQFESRMRLLQMGNKSIGLEGVGDRAYYSGVAAGVLSGERFISLSNVNRPGSKEKVAPEKVVGLLKAALGRAE